MGWTSARVFPQTWGMSDYQMLERDGVTYDMLTDDAAGARLMISRLGAEPVSFARKKADGTWRGILYRDGETTPPAMGWANHATVMGYYIHRLLKGRTVYRGHEIKDGNHGFMRRKVMHPPEVGPNSLSYSIAPGDFTPAEYPYDVTLKLTYALGADGSWKTTFLFANRERELSAHVGFGLHPGFAIGSLDACQILLPAGHYRRHVAPGDFLSGEVQEIDHPGGEAPFPKSTLPGSYLVELPATGEKSATLDDPAGRRRVTVQLAECPYLTLWSDGTGTFVCLEPCWGLPDHHEQRPFEKKLGIQEIPAGGTLARSFIIEAAVT
jgi:galactose mutarotase-like enzyme